MIRLDNIVAKIKPYLTSKDIEEVKKAYAFPLRFMQVKKDIQVSLI